MLVTRILHAQSESMPDLQAICKTMGYVRADLWRRYGALGSLGKDACAIRREVTANGWYQDLPVDGTIRAETTKDVVNDILANKAAAKQKVRSAIHRRTNDESERRHLYRLLRKDEWMQNSFLHRKMREFHVRGVSHCDNQFVVRADRFTSQVVDGSLVIDLRIAMGEPIRLITRSNGQKVDLKGSNLRIILNGDTIEVHYATQKPAGRACGTKEIGVDKGYTEAFADSEGAMHGKGFGAVLTDYSDRVATTGKERNRLHALEKRHRAAGRVAKADRIKVNNLGRKKLNARKHRAQQQLRTIAYQAAHGVVDQASLVVSEDLTAPIRGKPQWRSYNRRMSSWAKGVLARSLDEVCTQRGAVHCIVNAAYTSQIDSFTGLLEGKRVGDQFYRVNGDVLQADLNAARNVLARHRDSEITRYLPYQTVRGILLRRSSGATERQEAPVGRRKPRQRSAEKSNGQV